MKAVFPEAEVEAEPEPARPKRRQSRRILERNSPSKPGATPLPDPVEEQQPIPTPRRGRGTARKARATRAVSPVLEEIPMPHLVRVKEAAPIREETPQPDMNPVDVDIAMDVDVHASQ
jgi:hypothetical protein